MKKDLSSLAEFYFLQVLSSIVTALSLVRKPYCLKGISCIKPKAHRIEAPKDSRFKNFIYLRDKNTTKGLEELTALGGNQQNRGSMRFLDKMQNRAPALRASWWRESPI